MASDKSAHQVRIIAGDWRGRRLPVPDHPMLRPTGDRVRETVFNWLMNDISGATCLDLFAGTGALGLEAISRGAHSVTFVESSPQLIEAVRQATQTWPGITRAAFVLADVLVWLAQAQARFDIIFVDPPFDLDLQKQVLRTLVGKRLIAPKGFIYLESPASAPISSESLPKHVELVREKILGQVQACLVRYDGA